MTPSPSSAPSVAPTPAQTTASSSSAPPNGATTTNGSTALRRAKQEINPFVKNPSRPFALQAMQAANRAATPPAGSSSTTTTMANHSSVVSRASPIPKPHNTGSSTPEQRASPSGAFTPSNSQGTAGVTTPSNTAASDPASNVGFQDFRIVSTDRHGWKYDVMKFDSRKPIDVNVWARPVKLNRKEIKRPESSTGDGVPVPVGPMLGPDGKPVIGADGRIVQVDAEGRPIRGDSKIAGGSTAAGGKNGNGKDDKNKKKKFQKKTRQVFLVPEHVRQLRREERYPWVMEDASGKEIWEGRMEEASKAELYALFMPAPDSVFRFVPAHRWYKFQKRRPNQQTLTLEEAEAMMAKMQKSKDGERWFMRRRNNGQAAPTAGGLGGPSLVHNIGGMSLGPGGRRLRTVDAGMRGLFEEDDEEGVQERRRRERDRDLEGDVDEFEHEEDFSDDEEKMEPDDVAADEEAKELEERLKREYRQANKTREGYVDDSDEEEETDHLTGTGKDLKKLVRKIEKNAAYDSDEEKNPYASSEEEEEEETPVPTPTGPAVQDQSASRPQSKSGSRPASKPPSRPASRSGSPAPPGSGGSTNASGVGNGKVKTEPTTNSVSIPPPPTSPLGMGGHSIVAKRATSPKAPKLKGQQAGGGSRATSPLAGGVSRAGSPGPGPGPVSPGASRATSPGTGPGVGASPSKKRKADGEVPTSPVNATATPGIGGAGAQQPKQKKRKPVPGSAGVKTEPSDSTTKAPGGGAPAGPQVSPGTELTAALLVSWLKTSPGASTRECIHYFQPALTDDAKKARFTALVKEVASLKNGVLALKAQYRDSAGAGGQDIKMEG